MVPWLILIATAVLAGLAGLLLAVWRRWCLRRQPGAFPCKVRLESGTCKGVPPAYGRRFNGVWIHDVLILRSGFLRPRTVLLPTLWVAGTSHTAQGVGGLGSAPIAMTLLLDSGARVDLTAPDRARSLMQGPYAVAHVMASDEHLSLEEVNNKLTASPRKEQAR